LIRDLSDPMVSCVAIRPGGSPILVVSVYPFAPARHRRRLISSGPVLVIAFVSALLSTPAAVAGAGGTVGDASAETGGTQTDATLPRLEGIDVSHWQNTIDWAKVAAAGKTFAIIKATESTDFVDVLYATNHARAKAAGLWTGAYHFARPDPTAGDAIAEADHFASVIDLGTRDLIPALDLEVSGGLGTTALQAWVSAWLSEVAARTGVRPMIYTSPAFWKKYMGDSSALAEAGYKTLWIAHWNVTSPTVAANNWGGHGWTFWQYSSCGTVPGISGCVDVDRYNGADLAAQGYSTFTLAPTTGSVTQGKSSAALVRIIRTNFPSGIALDVSGLPAGTTAAFNANPTSDTTAALTVTTDPDPAATPTGTYPLTITGVAAGMTRRTTMNLVVADGIPPKLVALVTSLVRGTLGTSTAPGRITWSATDPSGIAVQALQRSVDGGSWATVALPTATLPVANELLPLGKSIRQRARATDTKKNTSAWLAGPLVRSQLFQQGSASVVYTGRWRTVLSSRASGGSARYATAAAASATFRFTGSSVAWVATTGPTRGSARIYLDGRYIKTISLRTSTGHSRAVVFARNWGVNGTHTLRIVIVGTAGHPRVDVDAFVRLSQI
jgi:GH25 family lysozyme M1 (1,4-beta-N-acetylmuramidase)